MPRVLQPLLLIAVALAGCGSGGAAPSGGATETSRVAARAARPKPVDPPPAEERPVATRQGEINGSAVRLGLLPLRRRGPVVALGFTLTARKRDTVVLGVFDDGVFEHITDGSDGGGSEGWKVDGIKLVDDAHGRLYHVARERSGECVCSGTYGEVLDADVPVHLSATFGAPPPDVTSVDVVIPGYGTFADVPLA